jgi:DNA invertase Pin-like site-specific DNA recombinase
MTAAISYDRWSTGAQGKGDSGRRQSSAAEDYCARNGLELDSRYIDRGISGWRGKNAAEGDLRRLLDDAESGRIDRGTYLLIENFDRLSRLPLMRALRLFSSLLDLELVIVNLTDERKYTSGSLDDIGELLTPLVLMSRANEESNRKSAVIRKAKAARRERVRAGLGVKFTRRCPGWLRTSGSGETFEFVPLPARVEIARRVLEESAAGLGKRAIATRLNRAGIRPFRGNNGWHHSSVAKLIANDALIGNFHPCRMEDGRRTPDGPPIESYYPAVVPVDLFWRAQAAVERRDHRAAGAKGRGYSSLFGGLVKCGSCGGSLVYVNKGTPPKGGQYLTCGGASRGLCNNNTHHPYKAIERGMVGMLTMFDVSKVIGKPSEPDAARVAEIEAQIGGKTAEIGRLVEGFGQAPLTAVKLRIEQLDREIAKHKVELEAHHRQMLIADANRGRDVIAEFWSLIRRMGEEMSPEERYLVRAQLAAEFRRLVLEIVTEGKDLVVRLKTLAGGPVNIRLSRVDKERPEAGGSVSYEMVYLPVWGLLQIDEFRPPVYTEDDPPYYVEDSPVAV